MQYRIIFIFILAAITHNCILAQSPYAYAGDSSATLQPSGHDKPHYISVIRADADSITSIIYIDFKSGIIRLYSPDGKHIGSDTIDTNRKAFTSVDPHAENYYHLSPYTYCGGNPVNAIDPNGRDWYYNNQTSYYTWYDGDGARDGFTHIGGKGSILGEFEGIIDNILTDPNGPNLESLYSNGFTLDIAPNDKGALISSKVRGWDFFDEFVYGYGPEFSVLLGSHPYTQELMADDVVVFAQNKLKIGETDVKGQITGVSRNWGVLDVFTHTSFVKQYIGSYRYDGYTSSDGRYINNVVYDSKSSTSLWYRLMKEHRRNHKSAFGNTYQFYIWQSIK